jgi:hypothetical protein
MNSVPHAVVNGLTYWALDGVPAAGRRETVHLLPVYDEYLVAYRDRHAVPHTASTIRSSSRRTVTFQHALVIAGQVAGTWRPVRNAAGVMVDVAPLRRLTGPERHAVAQTATRYGRFLDVPVSLSIA